MLARVAAALVVLAAGLPAWAAPALTRNEQAVINFGFATQLGSGIYTLSGRTLQVYRIPFGYTLPADEDARVRTRLTLPVTFGLLDFKPGDVLDTGLPEDLDALSIVPGVALDVAVTEDWQLEPFAEAGIARDAASEIDQRVYSAGLRSRVDFTYGDTDWEAYQELVHVAVEQKTLDTSDDFTRLRIGLSGRRPFATAFEGKRPDFLAYGFLEVFTDPPAGPADTEGEGGGLQMEVGITFGATEPLRLWRVPLPRVGLGYRFGNGLSVFRVVFGSPY
jgi:hypothetical protein